MADIFDAGFQRQVAALMLRDAMFSRINASMLLPSYFEDAYVSGIVEEVRGFITKYGAPPSVDSLKQLCMARANTRNEKLEKYQKELDYIVQVSVVDLDFTRSYISSFLKIQAVKQAMLKAVNYLSDYTQIDKVREEIESAFRKGIGGEEDLYYDYLEETKSRLLFEEDNELCVPTGITQLDDAINGGLREEEVGVIVGSSGGGKSALLARMVANGMKARKNTFLYSLEMKTNRIANRIDSIMTGIPMDKIYENAEVVENINSKLLNRGNRICIKSFPRKEATVSDLRDNAERIRLVDGINPHLIVIDYAGEIKPSGNIQYSKSWEGEGEVYSEICAWAQRDKIPIWTGSQINRVGMKMKTPTIADVAGNIEKIFKADIVIIICQTKQEKEQAGTLDEFGEPFPEIIRLYLAKNRDGKGGLMLTCKVDWASMSITVIDHDDAVNADEVEL